jgi:tetratricopeptide (TPR) repeat protein
MFGDALREFKKALEISEDYSGVYLNTVVTLKAILYNYCGMCNESMLNASEAMKWYFKAYDEENEFYQSALYNLLRIVRKMPEQELNSFVESLYKGVSDKKHLSVLSALMCNYMSPQLVKCYAAYRSDKKDNPINADVSAFIMAGEGKYEASANMFFMYYNAQKDNVTLMRTYLCATFSQNDGIIHNIRESCNPVLLFLFFNEKKPELKNTDISTIATFFIECNNIGHSEFALKKLDGMAELLCDKELLTLSRLLAERFFFEASFKAARKAEISANSIFMQGFCLFGMHRLFEATDLLLLARHLGYSETVVDELMSRISTLKNSEENNTGLPELKQKIMSEMESGNFENACSDINIYKRSAESDADILTAEAILLYYTGDYKAAAIAAESGLLKNEKNADLLYNAGCIYQKMGNPERAEVLFRKAIENCTDLQAKAEIEQELKTL